MSTEISFIVIDDSELDSFVTKKAIEYTDKSLNIKTFDNAQHALDSIRKNHSGENSNISTIILLDLQMPLMNGFEFVEEFEQFPPEVQKKYMIIVLTILTSKRHPNDIYRILNHSAVNRIIEKPFTKEKLLSLLVELNSNTFKK